MLKDCSDCTICRFNHLYVLGHESNLNRSTSSFAASSETKMEDRNNSQVNTFLRVITIACWVPALAFLLAHGISTNKVCPVLGIIPMTFSAITALVHLTGGAKHRLPNIVVDIFCATFLIAILVPGWITLAESRWGTSAGEIMVGTYGTVPMMVNFVLHTWFVLREIRISNPFAWSRCPHCHGELTRSNYQKTPRAMSHASSDSKESYVPVTMVDDEASPAEGPSYNHHDNSQPRPSTDDETARLV